MGLMFTKAGNADALVLNCISKSAQDIMVPGNRTRVEELKVNVV